MATREETRKKREAQLDELHERLTGAVEHLVTGEDWAEALTFAAKFRSRSFNNVMLLWEQHQAAFAEGRVSAPFPTYVAGFKDWKKLGRHVEEGQAGYRIRAPVKRRFASSDPSDPSSWRRLDRGEKPQPGETVRTRMVGVRPVYVWDVSQTAGEPIPEPPSPVLLEGEAPAGLREGLAERVQAEGFELLWVPHEGMIDGANGVTNYTTQQVSVRTNMDDAAQVKTLAHELGHVLMHGPDQEEARQHRGIGEVEAESVALMIGAAHGMDTTEYTIPYVAGWAANVDGENPVEVVQAAGERVRATGLDVLERLDTQQISDGTPPGLDKTNQHRETPERSSKRRAQPPPEPEQAQPEAVVAGRGL